MLILNSSTGISVKADPDSETMHRLDKAGQAVKKASEDLTKAAKDAREAKDEAQVHFGDLKMIIADCRGSMSHHHSYG